jgi:hypothetical protein
MFVKVNNGVAQKYTIGQLRKDNPETSFPKSIPDDLLANFDVYPAVHDDMPSYNVNTQRVVQDDIATLVNGVWTYGYTVQSLTEEEIAAKNDETAKTVRSQRDQKLKDTDWMGMSDVTMSADWATYRQALRDIPSQAGFPNTITWPDEPEV